MEKTQEWSVVIAGQKVKAVLKTKKMVDVHKYKTHVIWGVETAIKTENGEFIIYSVQEQKEYNNNNPEVLRNTICDLEIDVERETDEATRVLYYYIETLNRMAEKGWTIKL